MRSLQEYQLEIHCCPLRKTQQWQSSIILWSRNNGI